MLLRCGMKPGDCRHTQGTAVGVQGSETDPALMYTGPHVGDVPSPGASQEWKRNMQLIAEQKGRAAQKACPKGWQEKRKRSTEQVEHVGNGK